MLEVVNTMKKKTQTEQENEQMTETDVWKVKYLRALADYQNLEKRTHEHVNESRNYASAHIIRELLPVLDNLERASKHLADDGLAHIVRQFNAVFQDVGVVRIEVVGKAFDPMEMECIALVEGKNGIVIEELVTGYRMHEKVLRPAQVNVGSGEKKEQSPHETVENV
jgi:molecular chaperone GrpE